MDESVRWVTKAEAAEELEIFLSTLDRKIRKGEVEVRREGRRVFLRMEGPEYMSGDELLRRAIVREGIFSALGELTRSVSGLKLRASALEWEQDDRSRRQTAVRGA